MVQENCLTCGAKDKVVVVCGATASGKTSLAVKIARKFGGEVVSADSVSIYRGLDIGSAKPSDEEKQGVPDYMIDIVSPKENLSVGDYRERALPIVRDIVKRGKIPVICGGTGFYINSVLYNMSYGNAKGDSAIRLKYERLAEEQGKDAVYSVLKEKDLDETTIEDLLINDIKTNTHSELQRDKVVRRTGVITNLSENINSTFNTHIPEIQEFIGSPVEEFEHIYVNSDRKMPNNVFLIMAGLSKINDRIHKINDRIEEIEEAQKGNDEEDDALSEQDVNKLNEKRNYRRSSENSDVNLKDIFSRFNA